MNAPSYYSSVGKILFNGFLDSDPPHENAAAPVNTMATQVDADRDFFPCKTLFAQLFLGPMVLAHHGTTKADEIWSRQNTLLKEYRRVVYSLPAAAAYGNFRAADYSVFRSRARDLLDALNTQKDAPTFYAEMHTPKNSRSDPHKEIIPYAAKANNYNTASRYLSLCVYLHEQWQNTQEQEWHLLLENTLTDVSLLYTNELDWLFYGAENTLNTKIRLIQENCLPQGGSFVPTQARSGQILFWALLYAACHASKGMTRSRAQAMLEDSDFFGFPHEEPVFSPSAQANIPLDTLDPLWKLLNHTGFCTALHSRMLTPVFVQSLFPLAMSLPDNCGRDAISACLKAERKTTYLQLSESDDDAEVCALKHYVDSLDQLLKQLSAKENF